MTGRDSLRIQLEKVKRRLEVLEIQRAGFGDLYAPPHLLTDIQDAKKEITELEERLHQAGEDQTETTPLHRPAPTRHPKTAPVLRVFLASPGDVNEERKVALEVLDTLQYDLLFKPFGGVFLQVVAWDKPGNDTPMRVTLTPQTAIRQGLPLPSQCDIVLVMFWGRMGTPLPHPEYQKEDGSAYHSGTEWEFWDALKGERANSRPVTLLYRRSEPPRISIDDRQQVEQYYRVKDFFGQFRDKNSGALLAGVNEYANPENLRIRLTAHLRSIIYNLLSEEVEPEVEDQPVSTPAPQKQAGETGSTRTPPPEGSPFPGLVAFTEKQAPIFFGRGLETTELVKRLEASRFVGVIAASGSGKSSLVSAGLIPRLKANAITGANTGSKDWHYVYFKPGQAESPLVALFEGLCEAFPSHRVSPFLKSQEKHAFKESVRRRPAEIEEICEELLKEANAPVWSEILFFIDQFEELFSLVSESQQTPFVKLLQVLATSSKSRVIVTMRSDFYDRCVAIPELAGLFKEASYPLALPTAGALLEMIKRPAERAELEWAEGLPERIQEDTGTKPGSLALMAYLLDELYKKATGERKDHKLSFADYEALGGVEGAIGKRAEQTFEKLPGEEEAKKRLLGQVFRELVTVEEVEGRIAATRQRAGQEKFSPEELALVEAFTEARLLVRDKGQVEVAHEALFRSWERLKLWIEEYQEDLILRRQVINAASDWKNKGKLNDSWRWPQERLLPVYDMKERLNWQPEKWEEDFIEPEQKRLYREIENPLTIHTRRRDIGDRLSVIGEKRRGVGLLADGIPDIEWLPVAPGGKLVIEDHNDKKHTFKVAPFYIARYPVTYAQYEAFVKAEDGYNNPEWWQNFPEEYRPQQLSEQNMKSWNNPRDKISWYQAVAYTRWLNRRLKGRRFPDSGNPGGGEWVIGQGIEVRLPTEWEWQWAAQGGEEQRKYPWGEWQEGYANTSEAGMNRAIGVGLYPQGVAKCGALDMSGQLLEWCMNKYDKPGEVRADVSGESRVLRGGSFYFVQAYASCGARYDNFPYFDLSYYGFRVVVGAALSRLSEL